MSEGEDKYFRRTRKKSKFRNEQKTPKDPFKRTREEEEGLTSPQMEGETRLESDFWLNQNTKKIKYFNNDLNRFVPIKLQFANWVFFLVLKASLESSVNLQ